MGQLNSTQQIGVHQDLSDQLVVADKKTTPLISMLPKGEKVKNNLYEWPSEEYPEPDTEPIADGAPVDHLDEVGDRAILRNRLQILRRSFGVSLLAEEVQDVAGVGGSQFKRNKFKSMVALKRAMECWIGSDQDASLNGSKYYSRALGSWISASAQADTATTVPADLRTPAASIYTGTLAALTESSFLAILASIYGETGELSDLDGFVGPTLKAHVSTFATYQPTVDLKTVVRTFQSTLKDNTLHTKVDVIEGDFGTIRLHVDNWLGWNNTTKTNDPDRGYLLNLMDIHLVDQIRPRYTPLPHDGSGPRGEITTVIGNKVGSPRRHGKIVPSA